MFCTEGITLFLLSDYKSNDENRDARGHASYWTGKWPLLTLDRIQFNYATFSTNPTGNAGSTDERRALNPLTPTVAVWEQL